MKKVCLADLSYDLGDGKMLYFVTVENASNVTDRYEVIYGYSRRGAKWTIRTKTKNPVELPEAYSLFHRVVKTQLQNGFELKDLVDNSPYTQPHHLIDSDTGLNLQSYNPIGYSTFMSLMDDDSYIMKPIVEGFRCFMEVTDKYAMTLDGSRKIALLSQEKIASAKALISHNNLKEVTFDGVFCNDTYTVLDVISINGIDRRNRLFDQRHQTILDFFGSSDKWLIDVSPAAYCRVEKEALIAQAKSNKWKRFVFNHKDSLYEPGEQSLGGSCELKQITSNFAA